MTALQNATVCVTGANGGLGSAFVQAALDRGAARVYAAARKEKAWGDERVVAVDLDLTDRGSIARAAAKLGDTTILVNNAAIFPHSDLLTAPIEEIEEVFEANLLGPLVLTRELAPALRTAKGALLNVGSVLSWFAIGKAHSVSKAGLWMATNALRLELAPDGVQVLGAFFGPTDTPMQAGNDTSGMNKPADVVSAIFDALEAGEHEVLVDDMTKKVHAGLAADVTALYPALAGR
ncbi:SDR family oxidoreductase [Amycolatopsis sp. NPDC005232]|uniref:SDR family oxidoreductase n=1 Tax=Amycolatopsis sp. NPDC005232 TaxID=3157027 RepID=UPI0033B72FBB